MSEPQEERTAADFMRDPARPWCDLCGTHLKEGGEADHAEWHAGLTGHVPLERRAQVPAPAPGDAHMVVKMHLRRALEHLGEAARWFRKADDEQRSIASENAAYGVWQLLEEIQARP